MALPAVDSVVLRKTYPGVLSANREVDVVARVDGYIQSLPVKVERQRGALRGILHNKSYAAYVAQGGIVAYSTVASIPMLEASIASSVESLGVLLGMDPSEIAHTLVFCSADSDLRLALFDLACDFAEHIWKGMPLATFSC